ncbi:MAG: hypothetical protein AD742_20690 [Methylibium sp. NZG]|nr:MAG: hypothetical protein AD742_20690 [Methylibium sp. NZG]
MGKPIAEITSIDVYTTKSIPPQYIVEAKGKVSTSGWSKPRLEPRMYMGGTPPDGYYGFDFVADPPDSNALMVVLPVTAVFRLDGDPPKVIKGVRVHSANNHLEATLERARTFA